MVDKLPDQKGYNQNSALQTDIPWEKIGISDEQGNFNQFISDNEVINKLQLNYSDYPTRV